MAAGEFLDVYADDVQQWDAVVTVFMLDTAHNIIDYIETIARMLKPNGYWLNFGPLLYHYADIDDEPTLELPLEEVRRVMQRAGFEVHDTRWLQQCVTATWNACAGRA